MTLIRRYGDPSAPRFGQKWWVVVVAVLVCAFGVFAVVTALIHWIQTDDSSHLLGAELGIALSVLIVGGLAVGWSVYWRALARTYRAIRRRHPESLVLGARLPNLDAGVMAASWPPEWRPAFAPQRVVLRIDGSGVVVFSTAVFPASLLEITWSQVKGFATVEYVESRVAYEGLAIEGSPEGSAIVVQLNTPLLLFVRFPRGNALAEIAERANERRPLN